MAYVATRDDTVHVPVGFSKSGLGLFSNPLNAADGFSRTVS